MPMHAPTLLSTQIPHHTRAVFNLILTLSDLIPHFSEEKFNMLLVRGPRTAVLDKDPNYSLELKQRDVVGLGPTMLFRVRRKDVESWISPQRGEFWCTHKEWRDTDSWHVLDWAPSGAEGEQDGGNVLGGIAAFKEFRKPKRAGPGAGVAGAGVGMGYTFELVEWKAGSISGGESREE